MRTEEILAAIGTGLWSWDSSSGTVTLDAEAARLVGLPAEATVRPGEEVRPASTRRTGTRSTAS